MSRGFGALLNKISDNDHIKLVNRYSGVGFALRPLVFEIQGCQKSEMHRMTPE